MAANNNIPIVDLGGLPELGADRSPGDVVQQLDEAFSTVGFVYLKNHGVDQSKVYKFDLFATFLFDITFLSFRTSRLFTNLSPENWL